MSFYGFNPTWILLMVVSVALGGITQAYINSAFRRWSEVPLGNGMTGAQVAARVMQSNGIDVAAYGVTEAPANDKKPVVRIQAVGGNLSDNYDPRDKTLNLSQAVFGASTVAAAGVAAHEAGHAVQDAQGYFWGRLRSALVPVATLGSRAAWILIIVGLLFGAASGLGSNVILLGIIFYAFAVLFQLVTLPVELNASHRALVALEDTATLDSSQMGGARQVLTAAALTYVAAALISLLQLLYLLGFLRRD
jgi:Zn-dependent membrane protease YugP